CCRRLRHRRRFLPAARKKTRDERQTMNQVTKAVFPLARAESGTGPMAMTRMVDRPLIQYAIEEALAARITEMIFVSGNGNGHNGSGEHDELGLARELVGDSRLLAAIRGL